MAEDRELYEARARIHGAQGGLNFTLDVFGDELAAKKGYRDLSGIEALQFYLMEKHNWLPRDVRTMSLEDMRFALTQELTGWKLPTAAQGFYKMG